MRLFGTTPRSAMRHKTSASVVVELITLHCREPPRAPSVNHSLARNRVQVEDCTSLRALVFGDQVCDRAPTTSQVS